MYIIMLFWILQRLIVSLVLILCAHYIYIFLKTNLTTPKTRDLVNQPREKYKEMYEKINKTMESSSSTINGIKDGDGYNDNNNGNTSQYKMKNELKKYLRDLKQTTTNGSRFNNNSNSNYNSNNNTNPNNIQTVSDSNSLFSTERSNTGYSTY